MEPLLIAQSLIQRPDWVDAIRTCEDAAAKRWALYARAKVMLPYWESRYQRDDSMSNLVDHMAIGVRTPSSENDAQLEAAIPRRQLSDRDLCILEGFGLDDYSNCPADFAGDSIFCAARAFFDRPDDDYHLLYAFDTAEECLARLLVARDAHYDDNTDYPGMAKEHLREKMLEILAGEIV